MEIRLYIIWVKVFKNGPSKICGTQPLKNFTWSILEFFVQFITPVKHRIFPFCSDLNDLVEFIVAVFQ